MEDNLTAPQTLHRGQAWQPVDRLFGTFQPEAWSRAAHAYLTEVFRGGTKALGVSLRDSSGKCDSVGNWSLCAHAARIARGLPEQLADMRAVDRSELPDGVRVDTLRQEVAGRYGGSFIFGERGKWHWVLVWGAQPTAAGNEQAFECALEVCRASFIRQILLPHMARSRVLARLSKTSRALIPLFLSGATERQIAAQVHRSKHTVHGHLKHIYSATGARSRVELLKLWIQDGSADLRTAPIGDQNGDRDSG